MTANQIAYWNYVESKRHNEETERITDFSARESQRHNVVTEAESHRHNYATEYETNRTNTVNEEIKRDTADSQVLTNLSQQALNYQKVLESKQAIEKSKQEVSESKQREDKLWAETYGALRDAALTNQQIRKVNQETQNLQRQYHWIPVNALAGGASSIGSSIIKVYGGH